MLTSQETNGKRFGHVPAESGISSHATEHSITGVTHSHEYSCLLLRIARCLSHRELADGGQAPRKMLRAAIEIPVRLVRDEEHPRMVEPASFGRRRRTRSRPGPYT